MSVRSNLNGKVSYNHSWEQCDQIRRFLKGIGSKVPFKRSPNIERQFWALVKNGTFYVKLMWILFGHILEINWASFYPQHLVTLVGNTSNTHDSSCYGFKSGVFSVFNFQIFLQETRTSLGRWNNIVGLWIWNVWHCCSCVIEFSMLKNWTKVFKSCAQVSYTVACTLYSAPRWTC